MPTDTTNFSMNDYCRVRHLVESTKQLEDFSSEKVDLICDIATKSQVHFNLCVQLLGRNNPKLFFRAFPKLRSIKEVNSFSFSHSLDFVDDLTWTDEQREIYKAYTEKMALLQEKCNEAYAKYLTET